MARAVLLLHPDSRGPVMFSQDSTHDMWSFRCGIHPRSGFSWHSAPTCFAVSLLSPRSRKFWSRRLAVLSSLTKPGRFLHAPASETIAGDVATVETAWPDPAHHLSSATTPDASWIGPAGLLPRATRGLLHARSSVQLYWLRRLSHQDHFQLIRWLVPGRCATTSWRPLSFAPSGRLSLERWLGDGDSGELRRDRDAKRLSTEPDKQLWRA
ncbi:hypothetical protein MRX96_045878 [Rhipicephalus microplus]